MRRAALFVLFLAHSTAVGFSQDQLTCGACDDTGVRPCGRHSKGEIAVEEKTEYCSFVMGCRECDGTLLVDCPKCPLADRDVERRRSDNQQWLASHDDHFETIGTKFLIGESAHFELSWGGGSAIGDRGRVDEHGALHLYLDRLEQLYEDFKEMTGATDASFSTRFRVMVWDRPKFHKNAATHYCSQPEPNTGVKRVGAIGIYSVFLDPAEIDPDENHGADLYRNLLHNVSHLLIANAWNAIDPNHHNGGWIDAGIAHFFEDRLDRRCTNFCYREQDTHANYKGGRWRAPVKKLALKRDTPTFAEISRKRTTELTPEEHALAWSYCEFLISRNPKGFGAICRAIKEGRDFRDVMQAEFDLSPLTLEDEWKKHVRSYQK